MTAPEVTFNLFAFNKTDATGEHDQKRYGIPAWRLPQAVGWAVFRGYDTVIVEAGDAEPSSTDLATHHLCDDSRCPGGCE